MALRITKEEFSNYLRKVRNIKGLGDLLYNYCKFELYEGILGDILDDHIAILAKAILSDNECTEDNINDLTELLFWFFYEIDFGDKIEIIRHNNTEYVIDSVNSMYTYLNDVY